MDTVVRHRTQTLAQDPASGSSERLPTFEGGQTRVELAVIVGEVWELTSRVGETWPSVDILRRLKEGGRVLSDAGEHELDERLVSRTTSSDQSTATSRDADRGRDDADTVAIFSGVLEHSIVAFLIQDATLQREALENGVDSHQAPASPIRHGGEPVTRKTYPDQQPVMRRMHRRPHLVDRYRAQVAPKTEHPVEPHRLKQSTASV